MSRQQQQTSSSAGGERGSVMNCRGLLLDAPPPRYWYSRVGRWLYFLHRWMRSAAPFTYCISQCLPWGGKGASVEFVLTLQMFNEQAATAAGCTALMKWWHKTHASERQRLGSCGTQNTVHRYTSFICFLFVFVTSLIVLGHFFAYFAPFIEHCFHTACVNDINYENHFWNLSYFITRHRWF